MPSSYVSSTCSSISYYSASSISIDATRKKTTRFKTTTTTKKKKLLKQSNRKKRDKLLSFGATTTRKKNVSFLQEVDSSDDEEGKAAAGAVSTVAPVVTTITRPTTTTASSMMMPNDYTYLSYVACVMFCPLGYLAVCHSKLVTVAWMEEHNYEDAYEHSNQAMKYIILSIIVGLLMWFYIILFWIAPPLTTLLY